MLGPITPIAIGVITNAVMAASAELMALPANMEANDFRRLTETQLEAFFSNKTVSAQSTRFGLDLRHLDKRPCILFSKFQNCRFLNCTLGRDDLSIIPYRLRRFFLPMASLRRFCEERATGGGCLSFSRRASGVTFPSTPGTQSGNYRPARRS